MKNLTFLLLFLTLFTACNSNSNSVSEEKLPVNPEQWLSKIKNEEAKKRATDVLEKIYISTAYSVLEKDSLSEMQVKFANCELYDETKDIRIFKNWTKKYYQGGLYGSKDPNIKYLTPLFILYEKDTAVFKAALNIVLDTTSLYFIEKPYSLEKFENDSSINQNIELLENKPSNKILRMENEVVSAIKYAKKLQNEKYKKEDGYKKEMDKKTQRSIEIASKKLFQLLKEKDSYDYLFPNIANEIEILYSPDRKFRVFYFKYLALNHYDGIAYSATPTTDIYAQYINNEFTVKKIECEYYDGNSYCYSYTPQIIYQVQRNGNPVYITIYKYHNPKLESYTFIQPLEIKNGKIVPCENCIEDKNMKLYANHDEIGSFITFNDKQQITFTFNPLVEKKLKFGIIKKYILQWNGQQLVSLPLKLYCEE